MQAAALDQSSSTALFKHTASESLQSQHSVCRSFPVTSFSEGGCTVLLWSKQISKEGVRISYAYIIYECYCHLTFEEAGDELVDNVLQRFVRP